MKITIETVNRLYSAQFCGSIRSLEATAEQEQQERVAAAFEDIYCVTVRPEDVVVKHKHGDYIGAPVYYGWDPGQRPSELFDGPGDGVLYPDCDPRTGIEIRLFDDPDEKVWYYALAGYDTTERRWILRLQP